MSLLFIASGLCVLAVVVARPLIALIRKPARAAS